MKKTLFFVLCVLLISSSLFALAQTNSVTVSFDKQAQAIFEEGNKDNWFKKDSLFSTLLGGALALVGGLWAHHLQVKKETKNDEQYVRQVLKAIKVEILALKQTYDLGIGSHLKESPVNQPFLWQLSFTQDHFTVYASNATHLGKIAPEMSERIINLYALMKVMIEEFGINNKYIERLINLEEQLSVCATDLRRGHLSETKVRLLGTMTDHAKRLKKLDETIAILSDDAFHAFTQIGIK